MKVYIHVDTEGDEIGSLDVIKRCEREEWEGTPVQDLITMLLGRAVEAVTAAYGLKLEEEA